MVPAQRRVSNLFSDVQTRARARGSRRAREPHSYRNNLLAALAQLLCQPSRHYHHTLRFSSQTTLLHLRNRISTSPLPRRQLTSRQGRANFLCTRNISVISLSLDLGLCRTLIKRRIRARSRCWHRSKCPHTRRNNDNRRRPRSLSRTLQTHMGHRCCHQIQLQSHILNIHHKRLRRRAKSNGSNRRSACHSISCNQGVMC